MKHLSQIGTHEHHAPPAIVRVRRAASRIKWQYVFWFMMFAVTASIAYYAVHTFARVMSSNVGQ